MLSKVVHNKGGLYNRLTEQIKLQVFSLKECEDFVRTNELAFNRIQILQYYMIFGGLPFYWSFLKKGLSLVQNIDSILFEKNAQLKIVLYVATQICADFWLIEITYPIVWIITTILMILYHKKIL